jgi:hypothetical protein
MKDIINKYSNLLYLLSAIVGAIIVNYSILKDYAFVDAYESLWTGNTSKFYIDNFIVGGRPLYGYFSVWIFKDLIHTIGDLKWLRLLSVFTSVLFSFQLFYFVKQNFNFKLQESWLLAALVICLPSFTVYMGWSITFEIPISLICSFIAGYLLFINFDKQKRLLYVFPISVVLVIISLGLYQSSATAFLIPLAFYTIYNRTEIKKLLTINLLLLIVSFALYYFLFKLLLHFQELPGVSRSNIDIIRLPQMALWFYSRELPHIVSGSGVILAHTVFKLVGWALLAFFFVQIIIESVRKERDWLSIVVLVLILPLSYIANLISIDNNISMRTMVVPLVLVFVYQYEAVRILIHKSIILKYLGFFIAVGIVGSAFYNQNYALAGLQSREYNCLRPNIEHAIAKNPDKIIVIRPPLNFAPSIGYIDNVFCDEFGVISSSRNWVPIPMINQIVKEVKGVVDLKNSINNPFQSNYFTIGNYSDKDTIGDFSNAIIIDFTEIIRKDLEDK